MDETNQNEARATALRDVVERVTAWQETAPEGTIADELDRGLREAGVTLTAQQRDDVVRRIGAGEDVDIEALTASDDAGGPA